MIQMISTLIEKGYAYVVSDGTVYYRTRKFADYGKLSHKNLDDLEAGHRSIKVVGDEKEDDFDFVLWKPKRMASHTGSLHGATDVRAGISSALLWQSIIWAMRSISMPVAKI